MQMLDALAQAPKAPERLLPVPDVEEVAEFEHDPVNVLNLLAVDLAFSSILWICADTLVLEI